MTYVATDLSGPAPTQRTRDHTRTIERTAPISGNTGRDVQSAELSMGDSPVLARINRRKTGVSRNAMITGGVALVAVIAAGSAAFLTTPTKTPVSSAKAPIAASAPVATSPASPAKPTTSAQVATSAPTETVVRKAEPVETTTQPIRTAKAVSVRAARPAVATGGGTSSRPAVARAPAAAVEATPAPIFTAPLAVTPAAPPAALQPAPQAPPQAETFQSQSTGAGAGSSASPDAASRAAPQPSALTPPAAAEPSAQAAPAAPPAN